MLSQTIAEFCRHCGLPGLSMQEGGTLKLSIEGIGNFQMIHSSPKFLTGLQRKIENPYLLTGQKILSHCHFREPHLKPLHAQIRNDVLGLSYIFKEEEITAALLSSALDSLVDIMGRILQ